MSEVSVPYASSLARLRDLLAAAYEHGSLDEAAEAIHLRSGRHIAYYSEAAEVLGLARRRDGRLAPTRLGQRLLGTRRGSPEEAGVFRSAIGRSSVASVVPDLLSPEGTPGGAVAHLLRLGMKKSMAEQRGSALERWRKHVLRSEASGRALELPLADARAEQYNGRAMLRRLEIRSFKAFGEGKKRAPAASIDTPPLTLLAGPNGAGKSTILQALDILGSLVRGNIQQLLGAHGWEYKDLPHLLSPKQTISFTADVELGRAHLRWSLTLGPRRHPGIAAEKVERVEDGRSRLLLERVGRRITLVRELSGERVHPPPITLTQSWLATLDANAHEDRESFPGLLALKAWAERIFPFWSLDPALLRAPSRGDATLVGPRGGDLASFLFRLRRRHKERFEAYVARVAKHYPRLVTIEPKSGQYGWKKLTVTERWNGEEASFNAKQVSDGLLRLLAVASIPDWETTPSLVLLDEVENGLHPRLVGGIAGLLEEVSQTSQVIATTHSPITLNYVPAECTRLVTRGKGGAVQVTPLTETRGFERLREHFEPGELWYNVGEDRLIPAPSKPRGRRT